ncbi:helix-turn-helix domain-containing protein [Pseudomonas aeruginosa]|uniref:helix-turn-helix domain-containing protein n=1 Tax=Pseudomonas aeruginosa TaxID=287 RepID=UPI0030041767
MHRGFTGHACRPHEKSGLPLYEIALLLGFNDSSNFRRAFRKWTGKLPSDYREAP